MNLAVAWARWRWGAWRGETTYRGLALAHPQGLDLPGVLAPTALLRVADPLHAGTPVGVVWNRRTGQMSATVLVSPAGTLLADRSQVCSQVTSWGQLLATLANEELLDAVTVTVQVTPSSGAALGDHVRDRVIRDAPDLALTTMRTLVEAAPTASAQMAAWMTVVTSPDRAPHRPEGPLEAAAETLRCLDALDLAPTGADVIRPASDLDLLRLVRGAYQPADRDAPPEAWRDLSWHEAGPVAAEEQWDRYRHDGGISVSWVLREAPRRPVPDSVLLALLAPGRFTRRVALGYRVLSTEEAAAVVERQLVAADARQAYRTRTQRTPTRREQADTYAAERAADEEAYGAGVAQWSVTVTTTVTDESDLPAAVREIEQAAETSRRPTVPPRIRHPGRRVRRDPARRNPPTGLTATTTTTTNDRPRRRRVGGQVRGRRRNRSQYDRPRLARQLAGWWRGRCVIGPSAAAAGRAAAWLARPGRGPGGRGRSGSGLPEHHLPGRGPVPVGTGCVAAPEGVPLGPDLLTNELVCIDPAGWVGRLVQNPGVWIMAQPGSGKSAITKRVCLAYAAYGARILVPGDVKGEYAPLVHALGGQVVRIGRGLDKINPLDSGPLRRRLTGLPAAQQATLTTEIAGRRAGPAAGPTGHPPWPGPTPHRQ